MTIILICGAIGGLVGAIVSVTPFGSWLNDLLERKFELLVESVKSVKNFLE